MACGSTGLILDIIVLPKAAMLVTTFATVLCSASFYNCSKTVGWIQSKDRCITDMQIIADFIKEGSNTYLNTQYKSMTDTYKKFARNLNRTYLDQHQWRKLWYYIGH